jgi:Permeases of the drug/metabolite transporter (DMT) superfamily
MAIAAILWGLMAPISKKVLNSDLIDAFSLTTFRIFGAAVLFWIVSAFVKHEEVSHHDMVRLFFASLLAIVFNQGSFIMGISLTSPIDASIITTTTPLVTMIIAAVYLKEPITGKKITGIFIGAIGALLLILGSQHDTANMNSSNIWGDVLCFFAQVSFSFYFVIFKDLTSKYSPITLMKWMFMYASICCIPFSYRNIAAIDFTAVPLNDYMGVLYIVFFGTFISYIFLLVGQRVLRPTVGVMYNNLQPIVASIVAVFWGMDTFGWSKAFAVILVFFGVYIVTQSKSKAQLDAERATKKV